MTPDQVRRAVSDIRSDVRVAEKFGILTVGSLVNGDESAALMNAKCAWTLARRATTSAAGLAAIIRAEVQP